MFTIVRREEMADGTVILNEIEAPRIARKAKPGQFVILKANEEGECYFVTLTTVAWIDVFTRREYVDVIFDNLVFCRRNKGLEVFHYVLMPSHLHMIARRKQGLLSEVLRDFKSYTAKQLLKAIQEHPQENRKEWMLAMFREHGRTSAQNA